jgi:hypothetical protein
VDMKIVECMKCDHSWDILNPDDEESGPANAEVSRGDDTATPTTLKP